MPASPEIERSIQKGLRFLRQHQNQDGSFASQSSSDLINFNAAQTWQTTFVPSLILGALSSLPVSEAAAMRSRLASFVQQQQESNGAFNYWSKRSPQRQARPYPDDLDDTFCALIGLALHDPANIDGAVLAKTVKLLLTCETAVGGPYRTWLVASNSDKQWLDVDVAVNANIAYFMSLLGNRLPNIDAYLDKIVRSKLPSSPYYPTEYPLLYYLARAYHGKHHKRLLSWAQQLQRKCRGNALHTALCVTARLQLGERPDNQALAKSLSVLMRMQASDGSWPAVAFCIEPVIDGRPHCGGCATLTTAMACEALSRFNQLQTATITSDAQPSITENVDWILKTRDGVLSAAKAHTRGLNKHLQQTTDGLLTRLAESRNGPEITCLPHQFSLAVKAPSRSVAADSLNWLGAANLYGWLAYTIYDDFLDDAGQPGLLPAANSALRRSVSGFSSAAEAGHDFPAIVDKVFDVIDGANDWELANCRWACQDGVLTIGRLPNYGDLRRLAERSYGHMLPLLAVLSASSDVNEGGDARQLRLAVTHYLIARQLNDDLHDWTDDLRKGHISYVVKKLIADNLPKDQVDWELPKLIAYLRPPFWQSTLPEVCAEIQRRTALSRRALRQISVLESDNVLDQLLSHIDDSVEDTLRQRQDAAIFLKQYARPAQKARSRQGGKL